MFLLHFILTFEELARYILHFTLITDSPLVIYFLFLVIKVCIESEWSQGPRVMLECPHIIRPVSSPVHLGSEQVYKFSYFTNFLSKNIPPALGWARVSGSVCLGCGDSCTRLGTNLTNQKTVLIVLTNQKTGFIALTNQMAQTSDAGPGARRSGRRRLGTRQESSAMWT